MATRLCWASCLLLFHRIYGVCIPFTPLYLPSATTGLGLVIRKPENRNNRMTGALICLLPSGHHRRDRRMKPPLPAAWQNALPLPPLCLALVTGALLTAPLVVCCACFALWAAIGVRQQRPLSGNLLPREHYTGV